MTSKLDDVDVRLASQDGKIVRSERLRFCRHGARQKCSNCLPLDSYDEGYLKEKQIKHMSFHAYVKKLTDLHGKGTRLNKPLENVNCKLRLDCNNGHKPYPHGICTKCRPPTLTLNRQLYRHVDNITFENEELVNTFLDFWRRSSHQRVGYLIGRYEQFPDVPLGIKAVVCAIYEPAQSAGEDNVIFEDDPHEKEVDDLCELLNMKRVGWIFTDLWAADRTAGTVHCLRHEDSYLLSAGECITAGAFQSQYKNYTGFCHDDYFGSKFVTVVASGDKSHHINFSGYQVSNQCSAMVDAQILCPTTTNPELAWVREKPLSDTHYITDVQYTEKDEYGAEVRRNGRPMPVEYLLVDVPAGAPKEPVYTFKRDSGFPIENRVLVGQVQDLKSAVAYLSSSSIPQQLLDCFSNFHFLLFLMTNEFIRFSKEQMKDLVSIVLNKDASAAVEWAKNCDSWATFIELIKAQADANATSGPPTSTGMSAETNDVRWSCEHCTFENMEQRPDCAMCGLPVGSA